MTQDKTRQDELYALALSARRSDSKVQRDKKAPDLNRPPPPTAHDDLLSEFFRTLSPAQVEIYKRLLDSAS